MSRRTTSGRDRSDPRAPHRCGGGKPSDFAVVSQLMVSEKDREHFRRIAEAETDLSREALLVCARRDPGVNIEVGLELSDFAIGFGGDPTRPDEVAPIHLWRKRRRGSTERP
jgi:hypothetical protein